MQRNASFSYKKSVNVKANTIKNDNKDNNYNSKKNQNIIPFEYFLNITKKQIQAANIDKTIQIKSPSPILHKKEKKTNKTKMFALDSQYKNIESGSINEHEFQQQSISIKKEDNEQNISSKENNTNINNLINSQVSNMSLTIHSPNSISCKSKSHINSQESYKNKSLSESTKKNNNNKTNTNNNNDIKHNFPCKLHKKNPSETFKIKKIEEIVNTTTKPIIKKTIKIPFPHNSNIANSNSNDNNANNTNSKSSNKIEQTLINYENNYNFNYIIKKRSENSIDNICDVCNEYKHELHKLRKENMTLRLENNKIRKDYENALKDIEILYKAKRDQESKVEKVITLK